MTLDIGYAAAFVAGLLSFLSPCVLPLVPPYLAYLAGIGVADLRGAGEVDQGLRGRIQRQALAFVAGFSTVFVLLGAGATLAGQWLSRHLETLSLAAGLVLVVMGLNFLGLFRLAFLAREARISLAQKPHGPAGAYLVGLAFAFGWTPCVGPVLAAILMVAAAEASAWKGAALLLSYSLGIGLPFLVAAWAAKPFLAWLGRFKSRLGMVEKISGGFLVLTGLLILTGSMSAVANWLLINIPVLGRIG